MSDREAALEFERQKLTNELNALRRSKQEEFNKTYQGKFFKYRNSCGAAATPKDTWWCYYKVVESNDAAVRAVVVSVDKFGTATFEIKPIYPGLKSFKETTEAEFTRAATKALKHAQNLLQTQSWGL